MPVRTLTDVRVLDPRTGRGRVVRAEVDSDVLDIRRRLVEGDATCGWRGDPTARLFAEGPFVDPITNREAYTWLVICVDRQGHEYQAASMWGERVDHRIIEKMVAGDWQRGGRLLETLDAANTRLEEDRMQAHHDATEEWADKFHYAIRKDVGHIDGGTRRLTSLAGIFDDRSTDGGR